MRILQIAGRRVLEGSDHVTHMAESGAEALQMVRLYEYDAIILPHHLPDMSSTTLLTRVRDRKLRMAILGLDVDSRLEPRLNMLRAGADDYIVAPCDDEEIEVRLRAIVRRWHGHLQATLRCGAITLDPERRILRVDGRRVHVSPREFIVLEVLMTRQDRVFTRNQLFDHLYSGETDNEPEQRILDVFICRLRRKIAPHSRFIETVWGQGWRMRETAPPALAEAG